MDSDIFERDEAAQAAADLDRSDVLYLKHIVAVLAELRAIEGDGRVRYAVDQAVVAACERIVRLSKRDQPADAA